MQETPYMHHTTTNFITGNQCDLTDPLNGHVNCNNNTATYSCDPCWQLVGNERRTFSEDGIWTGYRPICSKKEHLEKIIKE